MSILKTTALAFFTLSYLTLLLSFTLRNEWQALDFPFFVVWGIGVANAGLNIYYGIKSDQKPWILVLFIFSGIAWIFPPMLFTYFGIPFLLIYLTIGIHFHGRKKIKPKV